MTSFTIVDYWRYSKTFPIKNEVSEKRNEYKTKEAKTHQYHDKIFKEILDDKEELPEFIKRYLDYEGNEKILKEEIEKYNRNFITKDFKLRESDIIYKFKNKNIFILVEHQSKIDYNMAERITEYCVEIIRSIIKGQEWKIEKYPLIYPVVLYTGSQKWDASLTINNMQEEHYGFPPLEYPKYNLVDINNYSKEELIKESTGISKAMIFEKIANKREFDETLKLLMKKGLSKSERKYIILMLKFSNQIREKFAQEANNYIAKLEEGDGSMTKFEKFFIEMLDDKYTEGQLNIIKEMIKNNMDNETIIKITKIKKEELEKIKQEVQIKDETTAKRS